MPLIDQTSPRGIPFAWEVREELLRAKIYCGGTHGWECAGFSGTGPLFPRTESSPLDVTARKEPTAHPHSSSGRLLGLNSFKRGLQPGPLRKHSKARTTGSPRRGWEKRVPELVAQRDRYLAHAKIGDSADLTFRALRNVRVLTEPCFS